LLAESAILRHALCKVIQNRVLMA